MKFLPKQVAHIRATWIYPQTDEVSFFRECEGSIEITANQMNFELRCTHGDEPGFTAKIVEFGIVFAFASTVTKGRKTFCSGKPNRRMK